MFYVEFFHQATKTKVNFEVDEYENLKREFPVLRERAVEMIGACEAELQCIVIRKGQESAA